MLNDLGILPDSRRYHHDADEFTTESLFYISRAGDYQCTSEYKFERPASEIEACQVMYVEEGGLDFSYGEEKMEIVDGQMVLIHLGVPHMYRTKGDRLRMRWFHVEGRGSLSYVRQIHYLRGIVIDRESADGAKAIVNRIFDLLEEGYKDSQEISICIHRILAMLNRPQEGTGIFLPGMKKERPDPCMEASMAYLRENYSDIGLSVEKLSEIASLSTWYYIKRFRRIYGITPHKYILRLRLEAARGLLDTTSMSVEEIAYQCGFSGPSHFIDVFRKTSGMTPLKFRSLWR